MQEIYATLFAAADLHSKVVKEVERQFNLPEEQLLRNRIRYDIFYNFGKSNSQFLLLKDRCTSWSQSPFRIR